MMAMDVAYDKDMNAFILDVNSVRYIFCNMKKEYPCWCFSC